MNNRADNITIIREACINANPEIMEVDISTIGYTKQRMIDRDIRLADVLLAIAWYGHRYDGGGGRNVGDFLIAVTDRGVGTWNLRADTLDEQSDECLSFIASLLGANTEPKTSETLGAPQTS